MSYINKLNKAQRNNIDTIIDVMETNGIKNMFTQAAVLAVISKESRFYPKAEISYANTSNDRIRSIFGWRVKSLSNSELSKLKSDPVAFFNRVYGGRNGNAQDEGYKYRGRGFNQITFKGNYKMVGDRIGKNLVKNPSLLANPKTAAQASVSYFIKTFGSGFTKSHQAHYNSKDIHHFKKLNDAVLAVYHSNAGFHKSMFTTSQTTSTDGLQKAITRAPEFLKYVREYEKKKYKPRRWLSSNSRFTLHRLFARKKNN